MASVEGVTLEDVAKYADDIYAALPKVGPRERAERLETYKTVKCYIIISHDNLHHYPYHAIWMEFVSIYLLRSFAVDKELVWTELVNTALQTLWVNVERKRAEKAKGALEGKTVRMSL